MVHYVSVIFRDYGYREKRMHARFKFLVADWGAEKVLAKVEELAGRKFQRYEEFIFPDDPESDHLGVHEQKQTGLWYIGVSFAGGRTRGHQLAKVAELAKKYAQPRLDRITTTNKQNLLLLNIPKKNLAPLRAEIEAGGLSWQPSNFRQGCVSCTGIEFCNLAIAETKNRMIHLVEQLEAECGAYKEKIRIHFSGCPSSCGQHQIADIGFRGGMTKINGVMTECFDMFIGGKLGADARFNELVKGKIPASDVHKTVGKLLNYYTASRQAGEPFHIFAKRIPKEIIKSALDA
jgi:ferredoxin-nitrite reductase